MHLLGAIIAYIVIGIIVGGLGRLVVPGRNPLSLIATILIGIAASVVGGILTWVLIGAGHRFISFIVSVVLAAVIVSLVSGGRRSAVR